MRISAIASATWLVMAAVASADTVTRTLDHADGVDYAYRIKARDGDQIVLVVTSTCPAAFEYVAKGIRSAPQESRIPFEAGGPCVATTKNVEWTHDRQWGGYIVSIVAKTGTVVPASVALDGKVATVSLPSLVAIITVEPEDWSLSLAGAFTSAWREDPIFGIRAEPTTGGAVQKILIRESSAENDVQLGFASFIHLNHRRIPALAATFGLGVGDANKTVYYGGLSLRASTKAALTAGWSWGPQTRLPAGTEVDEPVANDNVLSTLGSRTEGAFFVGVSFNFLSTGDGALKKPFAGTSAATR